MKYNETIEAANSLLFETDQQKRKRVGGGSVLVSRALLKSLVDLSKKEYYNADVTRQTRKENIRLRQKNKDNEARIRFLEERLKARGPIK